jgi:hypothetical protein
MMVREEGMKGIQKWWAPIKGSITTPDGQYMYTNTIN